MFLHFFMTRTQYLMVIIYIMRTCTCSLCICCDFDYAQKLTQYNPYSLMVTAAVSIADTASHYSTIINNDR